MGRHLAQVGLLSLFALTPCVVAFPQSPSPGIVVHATIDLNGDTVPQLYLPEFTVVSLRNSDPLAEKRFRRLVYNVKKVYPYAKVAGERMAYYNKQLLSIRSEKERKILFKKAEKDIRAEFEGDLRKLTFSQGHILIKLVDRQTGSSSFALVKDLRGGFRAFFYQGIARLFTYNLKDHYDPKGEDAQIEMIVRMIESGQI